MKAVPKLRFRTLVVPCGDRQDRGKHAAHADPGLETTSKLSYDRSAAIQKLPAIRVDTHFQQTKRRGPSVVAQQFDELEREQHQRVAVWLEGPRLGGYLPEAGKERR